MEEIRDVIVNEVFYLSHKDTNTTIPIPFCVIEKASTVRVFFSYSPKYSAGAVAEEIALDEMRKDGIKSIDESINMKEYLPIENVVGLSLSKDEVELGTSKNKARRQEIVVTKNTASFGFKPMDITPGLWELQLNCHRIASEELIVKVRIEIT